MIHGCDREARFEAIERTSWLCAGCRATIGQVTLGPEPTHLLLEARQISARLNLPVTHVCGRCGTPNHLVATDLTRWRRRGGGRPLLAAWPPPPALARPA